MSVFPCKLRVFSFFHLCGILYSMNYFALQVKTRAETKFIHMATHTSLLDEEDAVRLVFPQKRTKIRRKGSILPALEPIFPGYIFIETSKTYESFYWKLKTIPGFFRYLPDTQHPKPLDGSDLILLKHFVSFGPVAESSEVTFDQNDRIQVTNGPLKGLEGSIVKVNKRKGRAKVKLDLYTESFLIDFAFTILGHSDD